MDDLGEKKGPDPSKDVPSVSGVKMKPKKKSLVERELETSLTAKVVSPIALDGASASRYGRARRLKTEKDFCDTEKAVTIALKSPRLHITPVKLQSPSLNMQKIKSASSPLNSSSSNTISTASDILCASSLLKNDSPNMISTVLNLEKKIETIYKSSTSLSRFVSGDNQNSPSPVHKSSKNYIRKDLIQTQKKDETVTLSKNMFSPTRSSNKNSHLKNILERPEQYDLSPKTYPKIIVKKTNSHLKNLLERSSENHEVSPTSKVVKKSNSHLKNVLERSETHNLSPKTSPKVIIKNTTTHLKNLVERSFDTSEVTPKTSPKIANKTNTNLRNLLERSSECDEIPKTSPKASKSNNRLKKLLKRSSGNCGKTTKTSPKVGNKSNNNFNNMLEQCSVETSKVNAMNLSSESPTLSITQIATKSVPMALAQNATKPTETLKGIKISTSPMNKNVTSKSRKGQNLDYILQRLSLSRDLQVTKSLRSKSMGSIQTNSPEEARNKARILKNMSLKSARTRKLKNSISKPVHITWVRSTDKHNLNSSHTPKLHTSNYLEYTEKYDSSGSKSNLHIGYLDNSSVVKTLDFDSAKKNEKDVDSAKQNEKDVDRAKNIEKAVDRPKKNEKVVDSAKMIKKETKTKKNEQETLYLGSSKKNEMETLDLVSTKKNERETLDLKSTEKNGEETPALDLKKKNRKGNKEPVKYILADSEMVELEANCRFQMSDIIWARMGTFPFWPCIVTAEPGTRLFVKKKLFGRIVRDMIHVTFFGDNGRRSWIVNTMLRPFQGRAEFEACRDQFTPEDKKKDPRFYAAFFISDKKQGLWNTSVEEAETFSKAPKHLRLEMLYEMLGNARVSKNTPKNQTSCQTGRITRTDSDVSLSESLYETLFSEDDGHSDDPERSKKKRKQSLDVSEVVTACLDSMATKTGIPKIQRQSHMDLWLQKAKSKTPEKVNVTITIERLDSGEEGEKAQPTEQEKVPEKPKQLQTKSSSSNKNKKIPTKPTALVNLPYSLRKPVIESRLKPFGYPANEHDYIIKTTDAENSTNELDKIESRKEAIHSEETVTKSSVDSTTFVDLTVGMSVTEESQNISLTEESIDNRTPDIDTVVSISRRSTRKIKKVENALVGDNTTSKMDLSISVDNQGQEKEIITVREKRNNTENSINKLSKIESQKEAVQPEESVTESPAIRSVTKESQNMSVTEESIDNRTPDIDTVFCISRRSARKIKKVENALVLDNTTSKMDLSISVDGQAKEEEMITMRVKTNNAENSTNKLNKMESQKDAIQPEETVTKSLVDSKTCVNNSVNLSVTKESQDKRTPDIDTTVPSTKRSTRNIKGVQKTSMQDDTLGIDTSISVNNLAKKEEMITMREKTNNVKNSTNELNKIYFQKEAIYPGETVTECSIDSTTCVDFTVDVSVTEESQNMSVTEESIDNRTPDIDTVVSISRRSSRKKKKVKHAAVRDDTISKMDLSTPVKNQAKEGKTITVRDITNNVENSTDKLNKIESQKEAILPKETVTKSPVDSKTCMDDSVNISVTKASQDKHTPDIDTPVSTKKRSLRKIKQVQMASMQDDKTSKMDLSTFVYNQVKEEETIKMREKINYTENTTNVLNKMESQKEAAQPEETVTESSADSKTCVDNSVNMSVTVESQNKRTPDIDTTVPIRKRSTRKIKGVLKTSVRDNPLAIETSYQAKEKKPITMPEEICTPTIDTPIYIENQAPEKSLDKPEGEMTSLQNDGTSPSIDASISIDKPPLEELLSVNVQRKLDAQDQTVDMDTSSSIIEDSLVETLTVTDKENSSAQVDYQSPSIEILVKKQSSEGDLGHIENNEKLVTGIENSIELQNEKKSTSKTQKAANNGVRIELDVISASVDKTIVETIKDKEMVQDQEKVMIIDSDCEDNLVPNEKNVVETEKDKVLAPELQKSATNDKTDILTKPMSPTFTQDDSCHSDSNDCFIVMPVTGDVRMQTVRKAKETDLVEPMSPTFTQTEDFQDTDSRSISPTFSLNFKENARTSSPLIARTDLNGTDTGAVSPTFTQVEDFNLNGKNDVIVTGMRDKLSGKAKYIIDREETKLCNGDGLEGSLRHIISNQDSALVNGFSNDETTELDEEKDEDKTFVDESESQDKNTELDHETDVDITFVDESKSQDEKSELDQETDVDITFVDECKNQDEKTELDQEKDVDLTFVDESRGDEKTELDQEKDVDSTFVDESKSQNEKTELDQERDVDITFVDESSTDCDSLNVSKEVKAAEQMECGDICNQIDEICGNHDETKTHTLDKGDLLGTLDDLLDTQLESKTMASRGSSVEDNVNSAKINHQSVNISKGIDSATTINEPLPVMTNGHATTQEIAIFSKKGDDALPAIIFDQPQIPATNNNLVDLPTKTIIEKSTNNFDHQDKSKRKLIESEKPLEQLENNIEQEKSSAEIKFTNSVQCSKTEAEKKVLKIMCERIPENRTPEHRSIVELVKAAKEKLLESDNDSMCSELDNIALSDLKLRTKCTELIKECVTPSDANDSSYVPSSEDVSELSELEINDTPNRTKPRLRAIDAIHSRTVKNHSKSDTSTILSNTDSVSDAPLVTRRLRNKKKSVGDAKEKGINEVKDVESDPDCCVQEENIDTISVDSDDDEPILSKRKTKRDKKGPVDSKKDPKFLKYLELRQDPLIDEHPELTEQEILEYLHKTWLYEEKLKSDIKKSDDIQQSTIINGTDKDSIPKKLKKKNRPADTKRAININKVMSNGLLGYFKVEPKVEVKPRRKAPLTSYVEDYSDIEDEIEMFEIFKDEPGTSKTSSKSTDKNAIKTESTVVKSESETAKIDDNDKLQKVKPEKDKVKTERLKTTHATTETSQSEEDEYIDEVEDYFKQLILPKPNLFKGLVREKVCETCEKPSDLVKCKGCNGMFHVQCTKVKVEVEPTPEKVEKRGRKKKIKKPRRGIGDLNHSDQSHSDEKALDVSISDEANMSVDDSPIIVILDDFEEKAEAKMKELLETKPEYDSYSSDEGLDWNDTETGQCVIVDVKLKPRSPPIDMMNFKCQNCQKYDTPICFVCKSDVSPKSQSQVRQRCQVAHCHKYYHVECLDTWPQRQFNSGEPSRRDKKISEHFEALTCPRHVCHTCVSDDPRGCRTRFCGDKLARCVRCPATYHTFTRCLPAGSQILSASHIICSRHYEHRPGKVQCHVNTGWCFICATGGSLICCEYCPTSFHAECLQLQQPPEDGYMCEDCETGRLPLYGEMVWVKLGHYRWWPGVILHPCEIPENILAVKHLPGEFVVRFFGQYDHYWVHRGRVFPFQEGDSGRISSQKSKIDEAFSAAMEDAHRAFDILKNAVPNSLETLDIASSVLPPHYVKLKVNKPCGSLSGKRIDEEESSLTQCGCDPNEDEPCGPDSQCLNRMLFTECGPNCRAGDRCKNRDFEKRNYPKMVPYMTPHRGWGLKTLEPIRAGQFVIEYVGELIDEEEFKRRMTRQHEIRDENYYFLTLDKERMIDAGPKGNLARFMNHCCEPNCETQKWTVLGDVRVGLFAIKDIPANTEVNFNYNLECAGIEKKRCLCGAKRCSGYIGAKPKQEESQPKKTKAPHQKRPYKKRNKNPERNKSQEPSPSTSTATVKGKRGRPRKVPPPRELTEIEKDLLIIKNATNNLSSDSETSLKETESKDGIANPLKRKRVSFSTEDMVVYDGSSSPSVKRMRVEESEVGD